MKLPNQPLPIPSKPSKNTPISKSLIETPKIKQNPPNEKDEDHQKEINPQFILDLNLFSNGLDQKIHPKDDHIHKFNVENPEVSDKSEPRVLSCNYCQRKFYSSQALGGHQNAHKKERRLTKCSQRVAFTTFGSYYPNHFFKGKPFSSSLLSSTYPYPSNISSLPLYGSYNNHNGKNHRHLGIQAHSLIHKPSSYMTISSNGSSNGWSRMPMIDQQPGIGRLGMTSLSPSSSSSSNGGVARFDGAQKKSQSLDHRSIIGGICWKSNINVHNTSNKQDHDKLHNLDLSLKL